MTALATLLLAVVLLAAPYIGLAVDLDLLGHHLDTPIADLAAAALVPVAAWVAWKKPVATIRPSLFVGYLLFLGLAVLALAVVPEPRASAWYLFRKPIFLYVAYGIAVPVLVARVVPRGVLRALLLATLAVVSVVLLVSSVGRIAAGNALWFAAIDGVTNNHKTLAVAAAPLLPLVLGLRRGRVDLAVVGLACVAIAASLSRTAWIGGAVGLAFSFAWAGRRLAARRGMIAGTAIAGVLVAVYGPLLARSHAQLDAARSRHSLDVRSLEMVGRAPLLGMGGGAGVRYEMQIFPHYRINGVDAHGVVQKVASEFGLLGLCAFGAFVGSVGWRLRSRAPVDVPVPGWLASPHVGVALWATFLALHVELLLSTETFSQTHWMPLGVALGLARGRR